MSSQPFDLDVEVARIIAEAKSTPSESPAPTPSEVAVPEPDHNGEFACPADGAKFMAALGIPQTPLIGKNPSIGGTDWHLRASTDFAQIDEWARIHPGCNFGGVAFAEIGKHCVLEIDSPEVRKRHQADTNTDFPRTLTIQSREGRGHRWYLQTAESIALGNISQDNRFGDFSLRMENEQAVSPGSIHPNTGKQYRVVVKTSPVVMPPADIAWLRTQKKWTKIDKSLTGPKIPYGKHDVTLYKIACGLRHLGLEEQSITAYLVEVCEKRCEGYGEDYLDMCAKKAASACKYPAGTDEKVIFKNLAYGVEPAKAAQNDTKPLANASTIMSVYACDVIPHPIEYLWEPYLQTDALNAYYGNPGGGKGFTGADNVACLTTARPFPTEATTDRKPMNVVILDAEQGVDDTLVPRLKAAGADLKKVRIITTVRVHEKDDSFSERMITFQEDMAAVKANLQQHPEEKFLFIDPITNYVGDINFNQDGEVRPVLTMLVRLAEELKITIVIVGHFNKNSNVSTALDKPGGCRAWTAVPRSVWGFFRQSDNKQQRVMVNLKLNNAKEVDTGLLFTIEDQIIGTKPNGKPWVVGHIVWGERTDATADDLVAADRPESRRDTKGVDFINDALKEGRAPATMVYERAESKHISESTLKRACASVGVLKYKMPGVGWFWQHPTDRTPIPEVARELNQEARVRREQQGASAMAIVDGKSVNEEPL